MPPQMKTIQPSGSVESLQLNGPNGETDIMNRRVAPLLASCRHLLRPNGGIVGREIADTILPLFPTMCDAIPVYDDDDHHHGHSALASIDGRKPINHARIRSFIRDEFSAMALHALVGGFGKGRRIALVLPNGPELALAILATSHYACAVPLSASSPSEELCADLQRCGADVVIALHDADMIRNVANQLSIPFVALISSSTEAGIFALQASSSTTPADAATTITTATTTFSNVKDDDMMITTKVDVGVVHHATMTPNSAEDEVLVLFTSGTTGNKKLVPHCMGEIMTAAATIALSWDLTPMDVNINLMPLFHVGGIVRQVFSPIFSGGCVICCPSFDPSIFWSLLTTVKTTTTLPLTATVPAFTWYYAAPTMHQLILQQGRDDGHVSEKTGACPYKLRMIANAAGGLLPSLAQEMMRAFDANVLPSYGMTECMPISSPPSTYRLEKPGTSGVPVGPEVAILNTMTMTPLQPNEEGPICVRGTPCFLGYGKIANEASSPNEATFLKGGWFNTGDLGFMDQDGYLFITGRSKEVINRGGEIISPMEVEEAVTSHPDVVTCAAFSAVHSVLQEVVGIVIVMKAGRPRLDLPSLHEYLGDRLAAPKWPQCLVLMDGGLPKSHTNKLLRVKLGSRFQLPELSDAMHTTERTFEAKCPPQGTGLDVPIPARSVSVDASDMERKLQPLLVKPGGHERLTVVPHPSRSGAFCCYLVNIERTKALETAITSMDRYMVPSHFVETSELAFASRTFPPPEMTDAVASILQGEQPSGPVDLVVQMVQHMLIEILDLDYLPAPDANFFHLGGSSMLASQFASKIRMRFAIACSGSEIFQNPSSNEMAKLIRHRSDGFTASSSASLTSGSQDGMSLSNKSVSDHGAPFETDRLAPQYSFGGALFQLVPMFVIFPIWQVTRYLLFFCLLLWSIGNVPGDRDIGKFIIAYLAFHTIWITVTPLVFVIIKWAVIGRYKPGRYPIWGNYYLRWWFVDICRKLFLRGIWGCNEVTLNAYYRLLGAKIGKGARISLECDVAEFDLVEVGDGAAVEFATLRGFGVDNGAMMLGPVKVGHYASLGAKSVVAPYTSIPDHSHLGPGTSSYDVGKALDVKHARVNRKCLPEPDLSRQLFVIGPTTFLVNAVSQIPPFFVLFLMLKYKGDHSDCFSTWNDLMRWLCDPHRIRYYIGIRVARALFSPFFYMAAALFVKKTMIGKFNAGPRDTLSQWQLVRHALAATLFSRAKIQDITDLVGRHYELVSVLYRCLGAKVGSRVFWPGHQPTFSGEFDLLEVGDDVVFGSRSSIFFTTTDSCEKVILCAGSNVADNCVVLPGSIIGKSAVLGSNSVCPEGWFLPERSVWLGSSAGEPCCLDKGAEVDLVGPIMASEVKPDMIPMTGDDSTLRPFGKAFYLKKANYFVWPLEWIVCASFNIKMFVVTFHAMPLLAALHWASAFLYGWSFSDRDYDEEYHPLFIYLIVLCMFLLANFFRVAMWVVIELTAKWTLIGRRVEGRYNYDTTSYAQRWELYQMIAKLRKFSRLNFLDFFSGTPYMAAYFRWNGGTIGKDCCLYPAGADPFMAEPDLLFMGDRCVVDCASIVSHLNTRGNFELVKIILENDCTLRTRSRVQQGVYMEEGSQLLEKSLALTGEVIEAYSVWQGGPASWWFQYDGEKDEQVHDESTKLLQGKASYYNV